MKSLYIYILHIEIIIFAPELKIIKYQLQVTEGRNENLIELVSLHLTAVLLLLTAPFNAKH